MKCPHQVSAKSFLQPPSLDLFRFSLSCMRTTGSVAEVILCEVKPKEQSGTLTTV